MHTKTITALAQGLRDREFSSVELTQHFLARIHQYSELNAYITITEEAALSAAAHADTLLATGNAPTLAGIPIGQKDIFCTLGVKTS